MDVTSGRGRYRTINRVAAHVLLVTMLGACSDGVAAPKYGFLRVTTTTTGGDFDVDGYTLLVDGQSAWIDVNDSWERSLSEGTHLLGLEDLAGNCVHPDPQEVTVVAGAIVEIGFESACAPGPDLAGIRILFQDPTGLALVNADGSDRVALLSGSEPDLSPDGTRLIFTREGGIWMADVDGGGQAIVVAGAAGNPRWSPDGTRVAYASTSSGFEGTLRVFDIGDGSDTWLASTGNLLSDFPSAWPSFSPDGSEIAYSSYNDVGIIPAIGGPSTALVRGSYPAWGADGRVAYVTGQSDGQYIKSVMPDGTGETTIVRTPFRTLAAPREWSADGELLLYSAASPSGGVDVYLVRTQDGTLVRVTGDRASSAPVFWPSAP